MIYTDDRTLSRKVLLQSSTARAARRKRGRLAVRMLALVAVGFGLLTISKGGAVLFTDGAARAAAGDYVAFVLWFNFAAGFAYLAAGVGVWMRQRWAALLAVGIALATAYTFVFFGVHVLYGGAYEARTVIAMSVRTLVWSSIAVLSWRWILRHCKRRGAS